MKCPNCKEEIKKINIISECWQKGEVEGNKIINLGRIEEITGTVKIEHAKFGCWADVSNLITE